MIYPWNVHKDVVSSNKTKTSDKTKFAVALTVIVCIVSYFVLGGFLQNFLGVDSSIAIWIILAIVFAVGTYLVRFLVFHEDELVDNYQKKDSDSFIKYVQYRKEVENEVSTPYFTVKSFEYLHGNSFCVLQLAFGSNDATKTKNTKDMFTQIFNTLSSSGLTFRTIDMPEDFEKSSEYKQHIKLRNQIPDKKLAHHLLKVSSNVLEDCRTHSNVSTIFLLIQTSNPFQQIEYENAIISVLKIIKENRTAVRDFHFLDKDELIHTLFEEFYQLMVIDLSAMKVMEMSNEVNETYTDIMSMFMIEAQDDSILKSTEKLDKNFRNNSRRI